MNRNKEILKHCPNFYKISNFEFYEEDTVTEKLIELYKNFIFSIDINNSNHIQICEKMDTIVNKYLSDYFFKKEMKVLLDSNKENLLNKVIDLYDAYEMGYTRNIYFARWI